MLLNGTFHLHEALHLDARDSGAAAARRVLWTSAPDAPAPAVLSGSVPLLGLAWQEAGGGVFAAGVQAVLGGRGRTGVLSRVCAVPALGRGNPAHRSSLCFWAGDTAAPCGGSTQRLPGAARFNR